MDGVSMPDTNHKKLTPEDMSNSSSYEIDHCHEIERILTRAAERLQRSDLYSRENTGRNIMAIEGLMRETICKIDHVLIDLVKEKIAKTDGNS
jgi:hypothetical protein